MKNSKNYDLGIMFRREHAPETLPDFARNTERAGFDELWVVEDCFYTSGIAAAATALACTDTITVGLGIMPAVVRNPVFAAMEIATLCRIYPGRFLPGFGHGVAGWMRQIGALPKSQLNALEEVTFTTAKLLAGEEVTFNGRYVKLDQTKLVHPPDDAPPISLGVIGPNSLQVSGRVAGGTILSEYCNPGYVSWAKKQIESGKQKENPDSAHRLTIFAYACAASTTNAAHQKLRPMIAAAMASGGIDTKLAAMGILPQARELREAGGQAKIEKNMPDEWISQLSIAGTPDDWKLAIERFVELGVQSIVLVPLPDAGLDEVDIFARHLSL